MPFLGWQPYFCNDNQAVGFIVESYTPGKALWLAGLSYHQSDASFRGRYAISEDQYEQILGRAGKQGISALFILSTCNRTEIYGFAESPADLVRTVCDYPGSLAEDFIEQAYIKCNEIAWQHLFQVAAGLDSQILGDYEILSQLKKSYYFSKSRGYTNSYMDRLFDTVLQSSRAIRTHTQLSSGTVSVSFAAVQFIKENMAHLNEAKILILGAGEIGRNTCLNLLTVTTAGNITIINRSTERGRALALETGTNFARYEELPLLLESCDIIIVATAAKQPLLHSRDFRPGTRKVLVDLSVPRNIHPDVNLHQGITLADVDDLGKIKDATYRKRQAEVPLAKELISQYIDAFREWLHMRRHASLLKGVKEKLCTLNVDYPDEMDRSAGIQKAVAKMARKIRFDNDRMGCNYIETLYGYLSENN